MDKNKFKNRRVDKIPVDKSKKHLWKYIQSKIELGEKKAPARPNTFLESLKSLFMPKKLALAGAVAAVLIVAIVAYTLDFSFFSMKMKTVHASFEMEADDEDSSGVEADTTFTLKASEDLSEGTIEDNLKVEPEVELEVDKVGNGKYKVSSKGNLESNKIYTFLIVTADEDFSWAYQVKDTFKITGTLPGDKSDHVPIDSGIEIYFSHENYDLDDAERYFKISPKVDGRFEYHYRTLVFVPKGGLEKGAVYTVTLEKVCLCLIAIRN